MNAYVHLYLRQSAFFFKFDTTVNLMSKETSAHFTDASAKKFDFIVHPMPNLTSLSLLRSHDKSKHIHLFLIA